MPDSKLTVKFTELKRTMLFCDDYFVLFWPDLAGGVRYAIHSFDTGRLICASSNAFEDLKRAKKWAKLRVEALVINGKKRVK